MAAVAEKREAEEPSTFALSLSFKDGYEFAVDFQHTGVAELVVDEHPPIGAGRGPNPARMLAAAVGHCLASSLLFCVRKARIDVRDFPVRVEGTMVRNERGRLRVGELKVQLAPEIRVEDRGRLGRCLEIFEDFCVLTQSVRHGVKVEVDVAPQP
ncbi:MAG: OsmC family protein [Gemmatimonadetes bacterium]|nr:OsmC family protein [Gemmatimonadota bacterium]MBI2403851.1 OsmC family protein [Gemmatimonadota bacterium]